MSIKTKIIVATTIVLGIAFSSFSYIIYQRAKVAYWGRLDARLQGYAGTFREEVDEQTNERRFPTVLDFEGLKSKGLVGSLFRLVDEQSNVVVDDSTLHVQPLIPFDQLVHRQSKFNDVDLKGEQYRSLWTVIERERGDRYFLQIALPATEVEANLRLLQLLFMGGVPIVLILSALAVYLVVAGAFKPISTIVHTTESISAANLHERITLPHRRDEVLRLASTFNTMMDRIERAFTSQKQFVADASHEIRTPLAIVRSELEFARKQANDEQVRESIATALDEVERLKVLSDNLLTLARIDADSVVLSKRDVRLDELLADSVRKMKTISEKKKISLVLHIDEVSTIQADREKLQRAVLNLLDNALKHSPEGGTVTLSTRKNVDKVEIVVCDEGDGIPEEERERIFERFHKSDAQRSSGEGSGLGLAIVQGIVDLHHGSISVASEPGKGAAFTISLPLNITE